MAFPNIEFHLLLIESIGTFAYASFIMKRTFAFITLFIFSGLSFASGSGSTEGSFCKYLLESELTIDNLAPQVGRSFLMDFPSTLFLNREVQLTVLALTDFDPNPDTSHLPPKNQVIGFPIRPMLNAGINPPANRTSVFIGPPPPGTGKAETLNVIKLAVQEYVSNHMALWPIKIGVRKIRDFVPDSQTDSFEVVGNPMSVFPREWQRRLLIQLRSKLPPMITKNMIEIWLKRADNTVFSVEGLPPRQERPKIPSIFELERGGLPLFGGASAKIQELFKDYDGSINPDDIYLREFLNRMRSHYFGDSRAIDEAELKEVYRKHIYFKVVPL